MGEKKKKPVRQSFLYLSPESKGGRPMTKALFQHPQPPCVRSPKKKHAEKVTTNLRKGEKTTPLWVVTEKEARLANSEKQFPPIGGKVGGGERGTLNRDGGKEWVNLQLRRNNSD